jgi:hypothetical protein
MTPFVMYDQTAFEDFLRSLHLDQSHIDEAVRKGNPTDADKVALVFLDKEIVKSGGDSVIVKRTGAETHEMTISLDSKVKTLAVDVKVPPRNDAFTDLLKKLNHT